MDTGTHSLRESRADALEAENVQRHRVSAPRQVLSSSSCSDRRYRQMRQTSDHSWRNGRKAGSSQPLAAGGQPDAYESRGRALAVCRLTMVDQGRDCVCAPKPKVERCVVVAVDDDARVYGELALLDFPPLALRQVRPTWFPKWRSRWMAGRPVMAESVRANVLLPAPPMPVTTTRRPTHIPGAISVTDRNSVNPSSSTSE
jgi:hypothetical protein